MRAFILLLGLIFPTLAVAQQSVPLVLEARLTSDAPVLRTGMVWRVFREVDDENAEPELVVSSEGGAARFDIAPGSYVVHAAFGRAGAVQRIEVGEQGAEGAFVLNAGGLALDARAEEGTIAQHHLRFSIFELEQDAAGNRKLIALNVPAGKIVRLNAGTYHVLSDYGTINAEVRADLQVKPGRVTRATLLHRGAVMDLRLVSRAGGDPIASTSWTVLTQEGVTVFQSDTIAPELVLAEGSYEAIAKNGDEIIRQPFEVKPGRDARIEVLIGG